ncbi:MAG TPA: hypothetical protein VLW85_24350 [Myxococcales bacterium]|nr:hypothetical protein [Myxococcales bacterium]
MIAKLNALVLAGAICAAPAFAAPSPAPAPAPAATPAPASTSSSTGAVNTGRIAWGNIGLYDIGISVDVPGFGSVSSSSSYFGINAGAAMNILPLAPDLPLAVWANVAISFASGGQFFPLTAGAAVRYDKLPVQLFGGLGFTIMPNTSSGSPTPVGLAIQLMGLYPLPMVNPNLSADLQIAYHILNDNFSLWTFTIGGAWAF